MKPIIGDYSIYDPISLDDLVLVSAPVDMYQYMRTSWFVGAAFPAIESFFSIDHLLVGKDFNRDVVWPLQEPLLVDRFEAILRVADQPNLVALLFFEYNQIEVHFPEAYLFSGNAQTDRTRFARLLAWLDCFADTLGVTWAFMVWDSNTKQIKSPVSSQEEVLFSEYSNSTYVRIEAYPNNGETGKGKEKSARKTKGDIVD